MTASTPFPTAGERRLPPPRPALDARTWKEVAHLLTNLPADLCGFLFVVGCLWTSAFLSVTVIGLPLLALTLLGCRQLGKLERGRARALLDVEVDEPTPLPVRGNGFLAWMWLQLKDPVGWRHAVFLLVRMPWAWCTFTVTLVSLFVAWPVLPWLARGLTHVDRAMVRALLSPSSQLELRIAELERGRGRVADTAVSDLRRIERDLHDGAQARLVALAMDLGLAREKVLQDPEAAARMVDDAHGEVKLALQELRDLARGIHPAILTDRGLGPALSHLSTRCTVPVTITDDLGPRRPAHAIEGIAYYTASELLQNISKHATGATHATLDLWRTPHHLMLQTEDNGHGGATLTPHGGLTGLTQRLTSVDGLLTLNSPTGGPTTITAQLPWRTES